MRVTLSQLKRSLDSNVCEVRFIRRVPVKNRGRYRRMLCTNAFSLLMSQDGRMTLNFRPARGILPYNPTRKKLIVTWDIFMQAYRQINMLNCNLVKTIPIKDFWAYFKKDLKKMTTSQKMKFMDL